MKITFHGASDDLIEIEGAPGADEYGVRPGVLAGTFEILGTPKRCPHCDVTGDAPVRARVHALYGLAGATWTFAPDFADSGIAWPSGWSVRFEQYKDSDYSMLMTIDTNGEDVSIRMTKGGAK